MHYIILKQWSSVVGIITGSFTELPNEMVNMINLLIIMVYTSIYKKLPVIIHDYQRPLINVIETYTCLQSINWYYPSKRIGW
jgi:hypothetical protein